MISKRKEQNEQIEQMLKRIEDNTARREASFIYHEIIAGLIDYQEKQLDAVKSRIKDEYTEISGQHHIEMCLCSSGETEYLAEGFEPLVSAGSSKAVWGTGSIERVYIDAGRKQISETLVKNNVFQAVVYTNYETYPVKVTLRPVHEELEKAEHINRLMYANRWDMPPVNTIYLQGFYDVCFCSVLDRLRPDEYVEKAEVDFRELASCIRRDISLMWNLRRVELKEQSFPQPLPQKDEVYYCHVIPLPHNSHTYLAELPETERCSVSRREAALVIKDTRKQYGNWILYELLDGRAACSRAAAVMSNRTDGGIISAVQKKRQLLTMGEIYRCVHAYEVSAAFDKIEVSGEGQLIFHPRDSRYSLNQDIIDYILSDMERLFAGCHFKGRLAADEK